jgi:hypothetical protein
MKAIDIAQRVVLYLVLVPVLVIILDGVFMAFEGRQDNVVVATVADLADLFIPEFATTMFADQGPGQTALLALAFYGVVALAVWAVFRGIRSIAAPRVGASSS